MWLAMMLHGGDDHSDDGGDDHSDDGGDDHGDDGGDDHSANGGDDHSDVVGMMQFELTPKSWATFAEEMKSKGMRNTWT